MAGKFITAVTTEPWTIKSKIAHLKAIPLGASVAPLSLTGALACLSCAFSFFVSATSCPGE
jgi:hypothetical protein